MAQDASQKTKRAKLLDIEAQAELMEKRKTSWRLKVCRVHLAKKHLTNGTWKTWHFKKCQVLKGAPECANGGWKELMLKLRDGEVPTACQICSDMLRDRSFDLSELQNAIERGVISDDDEEVAAPCPLQDAVQMPDVEPEVSEVQAVGDGDGVGVLERVRRNPHLQLLPPNTHKRRFPVKCLLCVRRSTGKGAVFDLITTERHKWLDQHLDSATHKQHVGQAKARKRMQEQGQSGGSPEFKKCEGLCVQRCEGSKLFKVRDCFELWAQYNSLDHIKPVRRGETGHSYSSDITTGEHIIVHAKCKKEELRVNPAERTMCDLCRSLQNDRGVIRMIAKCYRKHIAARVPALIQVGFRSG